MLDGKGRVMYMKPITNIKIYDLPETLVASGYAMIEGYSEEDVKGEVAQILLDHIDDNLTENRHYKRAMKLTKAPLNSGHVSWAKGVVVSMDITFTNKAWIELQRYHFIDIITSMSTMHRISKFELEEAFNEYTDPIIIYHLKYLQKEYNENPTKENYLKLLYSTPSGLQMTGRVTTNYLQLMNIYQQRRTHRLPEWRYFCQQLLEELPLFYELLEMNGALYKDDVQEKLD